MHRPSSSLRPIRFAFVLGASLGACAAWAADAVHPVKISKAQIAGAIFDDYKPVVKTEGGNTTHDVEVFLSKDKQFDAGMYRSGKVRAGDSVVIPADWTGVWDTNGYTKIYVIYSPGGPIEE